MKHGACAKDVTHRFLVPAEFESRTDAEIHERVVMLLYRWTLACLTNPLDHMCVRNSLTDADVLYEIRSPWNVRPIAA
jgi:hypothetical protein